MKERERILAKTRVDKVAGAIARPLTENRRQFTFTYFQCFCSDKRERKKSSKRFIFMIDAALFSENGKLLAAAHSEVCVTCSDIDLKLPSPECFTTSKQASKRVIKA